MRMQKELVGSRSLGSLRDASAKYKGLLDSELAGVTREIGALAVSAEERDQRIRSAIETQVDKLPKIRNGGLLKIGTLLVRHDQIGILLDSETPRGKLYGPGRYIGVPFVSEMLTLPVSINTSGLKVKVNSGRMLGSSVELTVIYRVIPEGALMLYKDNRTVELDRIFKARIEPSIISAVKSLASTLLEEDLAKPAFERLINDAIEYEMLRLGLEVKVTITEVNIPAEVRDAYKITASEKLGIMSDLAARNREYANARASAVIMKVTREAELEIQRKERDPKQFTEAYFRELLIKSGGWAIFADKLGDLARELAQTFLKRG